MDAGRGTPRALTTKGSAITRPFTQILAASARPACLDRPSASKPQVQLSRSPTGHHGKLALDADGKPDARRAKDASDGREEGREDKSGIDPLDPATRRAAQLAPPAVQPSAIAPAVEAAAQPEIARARVSLEELLPQLVKRIAWAGDKRKGTVHLELGAGRHAGTTVTVHSDAGRVRVEVHGTSGEVEDLRARIDARLRRYGLDVDSVT